MQVPSAFRPETGFRLLFGPLFVHLLQRGLFPHLRCGCDEMHEVRNGTMSGALTAREVPVRTQDNEYSDAELAAICANGRAMSTSTMVVEATQAPCQRA